MKNLRREVRLYKESVRRSNSRKPSEVATACEKLLPDIEDIFNKVSLAVDISCNAIITDVRMFMEKAGFLLLQLLN